MLRVRSAATARNISGDAIVSHPVEWCSPTQASSNPRSVEQLDQLQVALQRERGVLTRLVVGREERAETQVVHGSSVPGAAGCPC